MLFMLFILVAVAMLSSCRHYKEIGAMNMSSRRNVDLSSNKYKLIKTYAGSDEKEIKHSKYETINEAFDGIMQESPGGEFLMNVKYYKVGKKFYAVSGDVWGLSGSNEEPTKNVANFKGFKTGDKVQYTRMRKTSTATIIELTDDERCTIKDSKTGKVLLFPYTRLLKLE